MRIQISDTEVLETRVPWTIVQTLGYEWCEPVGDARLLDYVTVGCSMGREAGHLALCRVEQDTDTGEIRRVMIKPGELNKADA